MMGYRIDHTSYQGIDKYFNYAFSFQLEDTMVHSETGAVSRNLTEADGSCAENLN